MPRVSQPAARGAGHKSQKRDGGAVTPAGASWPAVGWREPRCQTPSTCQALGWACCVFWGLLFCPAILEGCYYPHFPALIIEVTRPGSQRRVCGAGCSPCLQSSLLWESGPLGAAPTWHPAPPASCDPPGLGHWLLCCYPALLPACSASGPPADPARPPQCRCLD